MRRNERGKQLSMYVWVCISGVTNQRMTSYESGEYNLSFLGEKNITFLAKLGNSKHFRLYLFFLVKMTSQSVTSQRITSSNLQHQKYRPYVYVVCTKQKPNYKISPRSFLVKIQKRQTLKIHMISPGSFLRKVARLSKAKLATRGLTFFPFGGTDESQVFGFH